MKQLLISSFALLLAAQIPCQVFVPTNTPASGTCNVFPFGQSSSKMQFLAPAANLGNPTVLNICDLAFAPCRTYNITFTSLTIRMAQTDAVTLDKTFAKNMKSNVKTVMTATDYEWSVTANSWNTIGLDTSYLYLAGNDKNLVIEIVFKGLSGGGSFHRDVLPRCYANRWTGTPPATGSSSNGALKYEVVTDRAHLNTFGSGCAGSNNKTPTLSFTGTGKLGTSMSIDLSNALATRPVLMTLNVARNEPALDLGISGAPGCKFSVTDLLVIGGVTDRLGALSLKFSVPKNSRLCVPVWAQFFPSDPNANALGWTSSNFGRIVAGK